MFNYRKKIRKMKSVNKKKVALQLIELKEEGLISMDEITREDIIKKQNRGIVTHVGADCVFCEVGDTVSFTRAASVKVTSDGNDYLVVDEMHVLAKF